MARRARGARADGVARARRRARTARRIAPDERDGTGDAGRSPRSIAGATGVAAARSAGESLRARFRRARRPGPRTRLRCGFYSGTLRANVPAKVARRPAAARWSTHRARPFRGARQSRRTRGPRTFAVALGGGRGAGAAVPLVSAHGPRQLPLARAVVLRP